MEYPNVKNKSVLKLFLEADKSPMTAAKWLLARLGVDDQSISVKVISAKIHRVYQKAGKLRGKGLDVFKEETFTIPAPAPLNLSTCPTSYSAPPPPQPSTSSPTRPSTSSPNRPTSSTRPKLNTPVKNMNLNRYNIQRKEKSIVFWERKLQELKGVVTEEERGLGHYYIRNTKRREERNVAARTSLRKEKSELGAKAKKLEMKVKRLEEEKESLAMQVQVNRKSSKKLAKQRRIIKQLRKERKAMKSRIRYYIRKRTIHDQEEVEEEDVEEVETKEKGGEFEHKIRFCVMELAGLEVATTKIGAVMETVGDCLDVKFSSLPSSAGCQRMIDEGQVLARRFVRENVLKRSEGFGVHKDGTSRKKIKILDTSVRTREGESFCLGWSAVASETGQAISEEVKEKLEEVVDGDEGVRVELLRKLDYMMNDRAANEKKSSRLLEEWRADMLKNEEDVKEVAHLHCAAHVLLGFMTNVLAELKKLEWLPSGDLKHPVATLLKDASDLFGPVGDHRGMRDVWEAFCLKEGKKSLMKNYKDNRFNGLFEVAAEVFHHHKDFLALLETHSTNNTKQTRCCNTLKNPDFILLIECLGLFFYFVTGPFWNLVISSKTTHQNFNIIIKDLRQCLQKCQADPKFLFEEDTFSCLSSFGKGWKDAKERMAREIRNDKMGQVINAISSGLLKTLETQLKDVIESEEEVQIDAPLTNLVCERHFGHLDASQRRRPHSSLHHHTSIIMMKQVRKRLRKWFECLEEDERDRLWKKARLESQVLRKKHQERDRKAVTDSLELKRKKGKNRKKTVEEITTSLERGELVAVACEDTWYPALVDETCEAGNSIVQVNFAELGKQLGAFRWPTGKDRHTVERSSVIANNLDYFPQAGGRYYLLANPKEVQDKYGKFK